MIPNLIPLEKWASYLRAKWTSWSYVYVLYVEVDKGPKLDEQSMAQPRLNCGAISQT